MSDAHTHPQPTNQPADPPRPVDDFVTTVHELQLPAGLLRYRAQAGRMVIGSEIVKEGVFAGLKPKAQIFLTSYTAIAEGTDDGQDAQRPVVFVFNGGPGSSSAWMHIGLSVHGGWWPTTSMIAPRRPTVSSTILRRRWLTLIWSSLTR